MAFCSKAQLLPCLCCSPAVWRCDFLNVRGTGKRVLELEKLEGRDEGGGGGREKITCLTTRSMHASQLPNEFPEGASAAVRYCSCSHDKSANK